MSDEKPKPFAEVEFVGSAKKLVVGSVDCRWSYATSTHGSQLRDMQRDAAAINAAVAAERRDAAAKALREAAEVAWCETCTDERAVRDWLRARSDAVERGE